VVSELQKNAKPLVDNDTIRDVATISANNDKEIGNLIADAYSKMGTDGILTIENSHTVETKVNVVSGAEMLSGWANEKFVTNRTNMTVEYSNPLVFVANYDIKSIKQLEPFLVSVNSRVNLKEKSLVIIAKGFEPEVYNTFVINKAQGGINLCLITAPFENQQSALVDMAAVTGATLISDADGRKVETSTINDCGTCQKIVVSKTNTIIIDGDADKEAVADIKAQIAHEKESATSDSVKDVLDNRLARLSGNIGVIHVGGTTAVEQKERYDRVEDAIKAVRSAIEEGVLPGGGIALINATKAIDFEQYVGDELVGATIVKNACHAPLRKMLKNAELEVEDIVVKIASENKLNYGYDVKADVFCDMLEAKVIDPAKVVRCALQNAASVAAQVINSDVLIVEMKPKE
jgi:chaperonin GroEL